MNNLREWETRAEPRIACGGKTKTKPPKKPDRFMPHTRKKNKAQGGTVPPQDSSARNIS